MGNAGVDIIISHQTWISELKQNRNFAERYHTAVLVLMARKGGEIRLEGAEDLYTEFYKLITPLLRPEDYEPHPSSRGEVRWHHGLREALLHMRKDKNPKDGRVEFLHNGLYRMTNSGWDHLSTANIPFQLLDAEIEELGNGNSEWRYIHPVDGTVVDSFVCSSGQSLDEW